MVDSLPDLNDENYMIEFENLDGIVDPTFNNDYNPDIVADVRSVDVTVDEESSEDEGSVRQQ
jgi:hypothetical protein